MTTSNRTSTDLRVRAEIATAVERAEADLVSHPPAAAKVSGPAGSDEEDSRYPLDAAEDRPAYHQWLAHRGEAATVGASRRTTRTRRARFRPPTFSVVLHGVTGTEESGTRAVASVIGQTFAGWELIVCDEGTDQARLALGQLAAADKRVRRARGGGGREAAINAALQMARGAFVAIVGARDELDPDALAALATAITEHPDADVLYTDEDRFDAAGERFAPQLKPTWSPDLLLGSDYVGQLVVIRRSLADAVGGVRAGFDAAAEYDLVLRSTEHARAIVHVPRIAYHRRDTKAAGEAHRASAARAIADALRRRGEPQAIIEEGPIPGARNVRLPISGAPLVSIIIPFRDEPALLATCAATIRANPGYDRFELVLVDNGSELPETFALIERLLEGPNVRLVEAPGPFNYSAINNKAVRQSSGELLLFLNNDIEARKARWLDALVGHALRPEVGAVGARLLYSDGTIRHAGVVVSLGGLAAHVLRGLPEDRPGYLGMATQTRNCTAVTGACMMTRREMFESLGGLDETLPASFNDVDYCMKLRAAGLLVVYAPLCELIHHESRSRGHVEEQGAVDLILERWGKEIAAGDPYHHEALSKWKDWCPLSTAQEDVTWQSYLTTTVLTPRRSSTS